PAGNPIAPPEPSDFMQAVSADTSHSRQISSGRATLWSNWGRRDILTLQLRPPAVLVALDAALPPASRVAKKVWTASTLASPTLERQASDVSCLKSCSFDTWPSSTRTDGTSGARSTMKPADLSGCLCRRAETLSWPAKVRAKCTENALVSR